MKVIFLKYKYVLLVMLLFSLVNMFAVSRLYLLKDWADMIFLCYPEGSLTVSAWEQFERSGEGGEEKQNEIFCQAAIWKSLKEIIITAEQTGREQKVSCYWIKGQPEAVFGKGLICGRYFMKNEDHVCLLDRDTVRMLFGSENVLGMEVQINGTGWRIIGVLSGNRKICVIPSGESGREPVSEKDSDGIGAGSAAGGSAGSGEAAITGNDGGGFDGAAVRKKQNGQSSNLMFSRIEASFGSAGGQKMDGQLFYVTACFIYFSILGLILTFAGIILGKRMHQKWMTAAGVGAAAGIMWLGIRYAAPGSDYLPSYWSDFDFFSRIFQEKAKQIGELALHQEFPVWQNIYQTWRQVIGAGIFNCVLCIISVFGMGIQKKQD